MSYSLALYELSEEQKCEKEVYEAALFLQEALLKQPDYLKIVSSPCIPKEERLSLLDELLSNMPRILKHTILLLCQNNKIISLSEVLASYIEQYQGGKGILNVLAITALPMSADMKTRLIDTLQKRFDKEIRLKNEVDSSCLGGIKLQVNKKQYDGSVKRQLDEMRQILFEDIQEDSDINSAKVGDEDEA
jgi:ATP synthase, F1 delta subunit